MIERGKTLLSFMEVFIVGGKYTTQKYKIKKGMKKMKKMKKISKIFLVLTMIFSQLSSVVTVLADEVVSKPLETSLSVTTEEELGYIKEYNLTYKSEKQDYEEEKEYTIELEPSFKYLNGTIENGNKIILTKTGYELNNETNTQKNKSNL